MNRASANRRRHPATDPGSDRTGPTARHLADARHRPRRRRRRGVVAHNNRIAPSAGPFGTRLPGMLPGTTAEMGQPGPGGDHLRIDLHATGGNPGGDLGLTPALDKKALA